MTEPTLIEMAATYAKRRNARKTKHALACARRGSLALFASGDLVYGPQARGLLKDIGKILSEMNKTLRPVMKQLQGAQRAAKGTAFEGKLQKMIDSVKNTIDTVQTRVGDVPEESDRGPNAGYVDRLHKFLDREEKRKAQIADLASKSLALVSQISSAKHSRYGRKARFAADPIGELKSLLKQAASMIKADGLVAASLPTNEMGNWAAAVRNGTMSESTAASAAMMLRSAISAARASTSPAKVAAPKKPAQTTGQPKPQGAISRAVDRLRTAASVITTKTVDPTSPAYKDALTQAKDQARQAVADYKAAVASHNTALGRLDKYVNDAAKSMAGASSVKDVQHFLANVRAATRTRAVAARSMPTPFKRRKFAKPTSSDRDLDIEEVYDIMGMLDDRLDPIREAAEILAEDAREALSTLVTRTDAEGKDLAVKAKKIIREADRIVDYTHPRIDTPKDVPNAQKALDNLKKQGQQLNSAWLVLQNEMKKSRGVQNLKGQFLQAQDNNKMAASYIFNLINTWQRLIEKSPDKRKKQLATVNRQLKQAYDSVFKAMTANEKRWYLWDETPAAKKPELMAAVKQEASALATLRKQVLAATAEAKSVLEAKEGPQEVAPRLDPTKRHSRPGAKAKSTHAALPPQTLEAERKPGGGSHSEAVSRKIATLMNEGKPQDQAVAIALDLERRGEL